ncbi:MAG TPA: hypothetical protein VET90_08715 [Candidatus Binatus sp.]|nr:hypothetical protein [Candidatus Binatus sp.]
MPEPPTEPETQPFVPVTPEPESPATEPAGLEPSAEPPAGQPAWGPTPTQAVAAGPVVAGTSRRPGTGWVNLVLALAIAVAIGGIGFAAGRMTAPVSAAGAGNRTFGGGQFPNGQAPNGQGPNGQAPNGQAPGAAQGGDGFPGFGDDGGLRSLFGAGGTSIQGTVRSINGNILTLALANGRTFQIALSGTTTYHAETSAAASDVQTGGTVIVRLQLTRGQGTGTASPTATDVTIVP